MRVFKIFYFKIQDFFTLLILYVFLNIQLARIKTLNLFFMQVYDFKFITCMTAHFCYFYFVDTANFIILIFLISYFKNGKIFCKKKTAFILPLFKADMKNCEIRHHIKIAYDKF